MNRTAAFVFLCLVLFTTCSVMATEVEPCPGDFDASFAINAADYGTLANCFTGPGQFLADSVCLKANLHFDHHVDLRDFATFQNEFGPCHLSAPAWAKNQFCLPGIAGEVHAMMTWDDGSGPALYVGGLFTFAGCDQVNHIAKWDGSMWSPVGTGFIEIGCAPAVRALAVFDDGTGPALYAGGCIGKNEYPYTTRIAKWDGVIWSLLEAGIDSPFPSTPSISAMTVFDDGNGPRLIVAGSFTAVDGLPAHRIASWDGTTWSPLGTGMSGTVGALTVSEDGAGPALYAGGNFTSAGGTSANNVAKWDGQNWSALGSGLDGYVKSLTVFDFGTGPVLYAGGSFANGFFSTKGLAKWNGTTWSKFGPDGAADALLGFDVGSGPVLIAAGLPFGMGQWNGVSWSQISPFYGRVFSFAIFDSVFGSTLFAGGTITGTVSGAGIKGIASHSAGTWSPVGEGFDSEITSLSDSQSGGNSTLYVGGRFTQLPDGSAASHIAKFDGAMWSALGTGLSGGNYAHPEVLTVFDDGFGSKLYVGGAFATAGGIAANRVASWDGNTWSSLGAGLNYSVLSFSVFENGTGPTLHAGGVATGITNHIANWNGMTWSALGSGEGGTGSYGISAIEVFDFGTGMELFIGGDFVTASGQTVNRVAKWNGSNWEPLGSGVNAQILDLEVFDDGRGPCLIAAGAFVTAGGLPANYIAKWDGSNWLPLGIGMNSFVEALVVFDDGNGPCLYAGGHFSRADGAPAMSVAKWNGISWQPLGLGVQGPVLTFSVVDTASGPALFAGGRFTLAGANVSANLAKWHRPIKSIAK